MSRTKFVVLFPCTPKRLISPIIPHLQELSAMTGRPSDGMNSPLKRSFTANERYERSRGVVDHATTALQNNCNVVLVATLGFFLIGAGAIGCVVFGIVEIVGKDSIFMNDGLGEVLTVLGTYFTIPYLCILISFVVVTKQLRCLGMFNFWSRHADTVMLIVTLLLYVVQQAFTDIYLVLLNDRRMLGLIVLDVLVFAAWCYYKFEKSHPGMMYVVMYVIKMIIQWTNAYKTESEPVFGPNGVSVMLFLCIPIIQFPLYVAGTSGEPGKIEIVEEYTNNFNLYVSHLLHSLDIISMYSFAFVQPSSDQKHMEAPTQFRTLLIILISSSFLGNNLSLLHLFYHRQGINTAEIPLLPQILKEASRKTEIRGQEEAKNSMQRRLFQYMLFMLILCDVPMLLARLELWRKQYAPLSIFVAKNIKDIVDCSMLMLRANTTATKSATDQEVGPQVVTRARFDSKTESRSNFNHVLI